MGINYFDTAPDYGSGRPEEHLGQAFAALSARPVVATKIDYIPEDLADLEGKVVRSLEASLKRLWLECVDVAMVHNPLSGRGCASWAP